MSHSDVLDATIEWLLIKSDRVGTPTEHQQRISNKPKCESIELRLHICMGARNHEEDTEMR